jgi:peptidoglycan/xylan/chitin deacetylase (PgdA/CDA1 family)
MNTTATNYLQRAAAEERATPAAKKRDGTRKAVAAGWQVGSHPSTHGHLHELGPAALRAKLRHAEEQLTYWQGAKFRALHQRDKDAAGARVLVWEGEVAAISRRIKAATT